MKLFWRIVMIVVITKLLVLLSIGYLVYFRTIGVMEGMVGEQQINSASRLFYEIGHELEMRSDSLKLLAHFESYGNQLIAGRSTGTEVGEQHLELLELARSTGPWLNFRSVDKYGLVIEAADKAQIGRKIVSSSPEYAVYQDALAGNAGYSDVAVGQDSGQAELYLAAPIMDVNNGRVIGAVVAAVDWQNILMTLQQVEEPQEVYLFNRQGLFIGSNISRYNKSILSGQAVVQQLEPAEAGSRNRLSVVKPSLKHDYKSLASYLRQEPTASQMGQGWFMILETPADQAFAASTVFARELFIAVLIIILISGFLIIFLLNAKVIRPVRFLSRVAKDIAAGDIDKRAVVDEDDEIGELARAFNATADSLATSSKYVTSIIRSMPVILFVTDNEGRIRTVNEAARKAVGNKNQESFTGKNVFKYFYGQQAEVAEKFKDIFLGKRFSDLRCQLLAGRDQKIPVSVSASIMYDEFGQIEAVLFIAKDLRELSQYAQDRLATVTPILRKVALGDFSQEIKVPSQEDEFTEHLVGLNLMIHDFQELVKEIEVKSKELEAQNNELTKMSQQLQDAKEGLELKVAERTKDLELAKADLEQKIADRTRELKDLNDHLEQEVSKRTEELEEKLLEVERFNRLSVGRELKMVELKEQIENLKAQTVELKTQLANAKKT